MTPVESRQRLDDADDSSDVLETWLKTSAVTAYDAYKSDPSRTVALADAMNRLRDRRVDQGGHE